MLALYARVEFHVSNTPGLRVCVWRHVLFGSCALLSYCQSVSGKRLESSVNVPISRTAGDFADSPFDLRRTSHSDTRMLSLAHSKASGNKAGRP